MLGLKPHRLRTNRACRVRMESGDYGYEMERLAASREKLPALNALFWRKAQSLRFLVERHGKRKRRAFIDRRIKTDGAPMLLNNQFRNGQA
jgi:hypothetical protein